MISRLISLFLILLIGSPLCCCGKGDDLAKENVPVCCHSEVPSDDDVPMDHGNCPCMVKLRGMEVSDTKPVSVAAREVEMVTADAAGAFGLPVSFSVHRWSVAVLPPPPWLEFQKVYCVYLV
jgi:hypothetical protein